jgi:fatty-acyl-CoA synthase
LSHLVAPGLGAHCRRKLAGFKVPKDLVVLSELWRNLSGKILKRLLHQATTGRDKS